MRLAITCLLLAAAMATCIAAEKPVRIRKTPETNRDLVALVDDFFQQNVLDLKSADPCKKIAEIFRDKRKSDLDTELRRLAEAFPNFTQLRSNNSRFIRLSFFLRHDSPEGLIEDQYDVVFVFDEHSALNGVEWGSGMRRIIQLKK